MLLKLKDKKLTYHLSIIEEKITSFNKGKANISAER
jgi:hypothetical protein